MRQTYRETNREISQPRLTEKQISQQNYKSTTKNINNRKITTEAYSSFITSNRSSLVFEVVLDHALINDVLHNPHIEGGEGGHMDAGMSAFCGLRDLGHIWLRVRTLLRKSVQLFS